MTRLFLLLAVALGFAAGPALADDAACAASLPWGTPTLAAAATTTEVCHPGYAALVDDELLAPRWVAYRLTGAHTLGCNPRKNDFHVDEQLAGVRHARPADYRASGYDHGHQAPAEDFAWDAGELHDSFSMANMAPQLPGLNRAQWERLEETVRAWALQRGELEIYVGPIMAPDHAAIGGSRVAVPAAFWKVIVDLKSNEAIGFEMPQTPTPKGDLAPWLVSIAAIERAAGLRLPLPAGIDRDAVPALWPADLAAWRKRHKETCH